MAYPTLVIGHPFFFQLRHSFGLWQEPDSVVIPDVSNRESIFSSLLVKTCAHQSSHVPFLLRDEFMPQDREGPFNTCTQILRRMAKDDNMMRRAFTALCHFRSVLLPLVEGGIGGFSASGPRHDRQWLSDIDLQKK